MVQPLNMGQFIPAVTQADNSVIAATTTWIKDNDHVLSDYLKSSKLGRMARVIRFLAPTFFQKILDSKPKTVIEIDCGSGEPSARILTFKKGKVAMSKKIEVNWGGYAGDTKADKNFRKDNLEVAELSFIAEIIKNCPEHADIDIRATAWARLPKDEQDYQNLNVGSRLNNLKALNILPLVTKNVNFRVISQDEEGQGAHLALQDIMNTDLDFAKGFNQKAKPITPERARAVDGGNRSNQGSDFAVGFGAADVRNWIETEGVDAARKKCREEISISFDARAAARAATEGERKIKKDAEDVPFFAGSHLFSLTRNEAVLKGLGIDYTIPAGKKVPVLPANNAWHQGVNARQALQVLEDVIAQRTADLGKAQAKEAALDDLKGLIVTAEVIQQYIDKRQTQIIRVGEYKNAQDEDVKLTHYFGGYIKDFILSVLTKTNHKDVSQKALRALNWLLLK